MRVYRIYINAGAFSWNVNAHVARASFVQIGIIGTKVTVQKSPANANVVVSGCRRAPKMYHLKCTY